MSNQLHIYNEQADQYHQLVARQPNLASLLHEIRPLNELEVAELGAGTGRLTLPLASGAAFVTALDAYPAMLEVNARRLAAAGLTNWRTAVADHRELPLATHSVDLVVAGWSLCYLVHAGVPEATSNLARIMEEIDRVLRPGGTVIIIETLGTGLAEPQPPDELADYYAALSDVYGFEHRWIRTDYVFDSAEQAQKLTSFFFSEEVAARAAAQKSAFVPECAGIWWKHK